MLWEDVMLLLEVLNASAGDAALNKIHAAARAALVAVDINDLRLKSQMDNLEPLEDPPEGDE